VRGSDLEFLAAVPVPLEIRVISSSLMLWYCPVARGLKIWPPPLMNGIMDLIEGHMVLLVRHKEDRSFPFR